MKNALGIAGFAAPAPAMTRFEGGNCPIPMTKYISTGWVAQAALTAALLAELGYTGDTQILDGDKGFWHFFGGDRDKWDARLLTDALGQVWRAGGVQYKPYPCEVIIGMAVNPLREILRSNHLSPDDVTSVEFRSLPILANDCHQNTRIASHIDAQFSVPYCLALAAHEIEAGPAWQDDRTMGDPRVRRFMEKVVVGVHPAALGGSTAKRDGSSMGHIPLALEVVARGQRFTVEVQAAPMNHDVLLEKFEKTSGAALPSAQAREAQHLLRDLEGLDDVSVLMDCLAP